MVGQSLTLIHLFFMVKLLSDIEKNEFEFNYNFCKKRLSYF